MTKGGDRASSSPRASSDLPSRPETPASKNVAAASADTNRASIDSKGSEAAVDQARLSKEAPSVDDSTNPDGPGTPSTESMSLDFVSPGVADRPPSTSIPEIMVASAHSSSPRPSAELPTTSEPEIATPRDPATIEAELSSLRQTHEQTLSEHREEIHTHLERIDALQSKLTYLTQQLMSQTKATTTSADTSALEKKVAEKDAQIAALMEEGQKLSKIELKHLSTIKKMRAKSSETDKEVNVLKERLSKAEKSIVETTERAKRAEAAEKAAQEQLKVVSKIEKDIAIVSQEREEAGLTITELRRQLSDALSRAENAEKRAQTGALEAEKRTTASLREDIENLRIEKKLAEDRAKRELQQAKEEASRNQEKTKLVEMELKGEISVIIHFPASPPLSLTVSQNLETKLELLRSRSEEVTSSATGDSQAKLLRQIETLQTQHAIAYENFRGIEGTLNSRVAALEKERDETAKREADMRRKSREANSKARRLEEELESLSDRNSALESQLLEQQTLARKLQNKLNEAESAAEDARRELEKQKKIWETELNQRIEEEKMRWRLEYQTHSPMSPDPNYLRAESPTMSNRRHSPDPLGPYSRRTLNRTVSTEGPLSPMDRMLLDQRRPMSNRKSTQPMRTPEMGTPVRQDSVPNSLSNLNGANISQAPSIKAFDHDEGFDITSSPHQTINDMISVSTAGAGPSVQLVERMSAAVRRLESEKATFKEETARLIAQRDEARQEVVVLMREIEEKRAADEKLQKLEQDLKEMDERYQTTLELLGEKSERVDELMNDVADLKQMYRDLLLEKTPA